MTTNNYFRGIDISTIQNSVDFEAVAASGIKFVICRCGVGDSGIDANYTKNIAGAKTAGLCVAAYNFIFPLPPLASQPLRDPIKQANYHFTATKGEIAFVDAEWPVPSDFPKWNCTVTQIKQWMVAYLEEYTRLDNGRKPGIYTYPDWCAHLSLEPYFTQYPLWIASYQNNAPYIPKPWSSVVLWQNSGGTEKLPNGVPVDGDLCPDLSAIWGTSSDPIAPPAPDPSVGQTSAPAQPAVPATQTAPQSSPTTPTTTSPTKDQNIANAISAIWSWATNWLSKK